MRERQPCVCFLASPPRETIYIVVTSDLPARLYQHRNDVIDGFTSRYAVHRLVRYEMFDAIEIAEPRVE